MALNLCPAETQHWGVKQLSDSSHHPQVPSMNSIEEQEVAGREQFPYQHHRASSIGCKHGGWHEEDDTTLRISRDGGGTLRDSGISLRDGGETLKDGSERLKDKQES